MDHTNDSNSDNVFDTLGLPDAAHTLEKAEKLFAIQKCLEIYPDIILSTETLKKVKSSKLSQLSMQHLDDILVYIKHKISI
jgi:hypothetical protein